MSTAPFTRASLRHRSFTGYSQVWLAEDHVLVLRSSRIKETYRRFLFADIQAIVITEGPDFSLLRGLFGVGVLILIIWTWTATSVAGRVFLGSISLIAVALLIREMARGPRCRCILQTAVSRERVDALSRTREARRFLELVTPRIESAQSHIAPREEASAHSGETSSSQNATPPPIARQPGFVTETFFGLFFLTALLLFALSTAAVNTAFGLIVIVYASELVLGGLAVAQARSRSTLLLGIAIGALALIPVDMIVLTGTRVWGAFVNAIFGATGGRPPSLERLLDLPSNILMLSMGWRIVACATGLFACRWERTQERA